VNSSEILRIVLLGFWAPLTTFAAIYFAWHRLESQRRSRVEYERLMIERERTSRGEYEIERLQNEFRSSTEFLQKSIDSKMEDIGARIRHEVETALDVARAEFSLSRTPPMGGGVALTSGAGSMEATSNPSYDPGSLIREISHALNTPLSHIEAGLLTLDSEATDLQQQDLQERLDNILIGVQACKSVIAGFRELILSAKSTTTWSPSSLREAISGVASVDAARDHRVTSVDVQLPEVIAGFSNNYLVALLLPLIENAVESAKEDTALSISSRMDTEHLFLDVTSTPSALPVSNQIYADGFSTKPGHTGTGLSIVKRLLSGKRGAGVSHNIEGEKVTFTITLRLGS